MDDGDAPVLLDKQVSVALQASAPLRAMADHQDVVGKIALSFLTTQQLLHQGIEDLLQP